MKKWRKKNNWVILGKRKQERLREGIRTSKSNIHEFKQRKSITDKVNLTKKEEVADNEVLKAPGYCHCWRLVKLMLRRQV